MKKSITIGITDCSKYENYSRWIEHEQGVKVVKLNPQSNNIGDMEKCDGVILSGGEDVHPRFYGKLEYVELCHEIDEQRDEFELRVMEQSQKKRIPLLGICRGLQVANVFFGGTLIPHIPAFGKFDHSRSAVADRHHTVHVDPNSLLQTIVETASGDINSAHHQAADRIGTGLVANALSPDGIVEGMELENTGDHPFLQLVQWHPERMTNADSAFSKNIKRKFLEACHINK